MGKKRYTMTLDETEMDILLEWIKPKGITLSGYFNAMIHDNVKAIKVLDGVDNLKDVSLGQLTELYAGMSKELNEEKKKQKKRDRK